MTSKTETNPHNMTKAELNKWAINLCDQWNWNAGIMEIAQELQEQNITPDSLKEFNKFNSGAFHSPGSSPGVFKKPEMPIIEAIRNILELRAVTTKFDPYRGFNSPREAIRYAEKQLDPVDAAKQIVAANIDWGEYGFAAEVCREIETIVINES